MGRAVKLSEVGIQGGKIRFVTDLDEDFAWFELVGLCDGAFLYNNRTTWKEHGEDGKQ